MQRSDAPGGTEKLPIFCPRRFAGRRPYPARARLLTRIGPHGPKGSGNEAETATLLDGYLDRAFVAAGC